VIKWKGVSSINLFTLLIKITDIPVVKFQNQGTGYWGPRRSRSTEVGRFANRLTRVCVQSRESSRLPVVACSQWFGCYHEWRVIRVIVDAFYNSRRWLYVVSADCSTRSQSMSLVWQFLICSKPPSLPPVFISIFSQGTVYNDFCDRGQESCCILCRGWIYSGTCTHISYFFLICLFFVCCTCCE